jgi:two-component system, NtrC family, sensor histidine kinase PilS
MNNISSAPTYMISRLNWLMLARVGIVTFLLGVTTFIEVMGMQSLSAISPSALFNTILVTYILSIFYIFFMKSVRSLPLNIYIQSLCDVLLITGMIYATGGIHSIYSVFYPLVIIYSVFFLGRKGGFIVASISGIFYGLFADLEFYGVIYPLFSIPIPDQLQNAGFVFTRIITHILSFYMIAFLASFVVEQERKTRALLVEKQSAFDQLDLLHRSIIESVDSGILTINLSGEIKSINRAATEITGLSLNLVENLKFSTVFEDAPILPGISNTDQAGPVPKTRFEMPFCNPGGQHLTLGGSVSPLRDHQGMTIGSIIIFQDLTQINEMKESLERSRRLAFIGEMAAALAHEIRNPLASMSGSIQMLKQDLPPDENNMKLMRIILRGKDQLENFLKDFLLMARPAPGAKESIDIKDMINEIVESLRYVPDWHEALEVIFRLDDASPLKLLANKTEIRQVIWNIMLNSVQAMPDGGTLTIEAYAAQVEKRSGVEIIIRDTGVGMTDQVLEKVFQPFYTNRDMGTGLGLAVVNRIVEGYQGRIHMQSKPGRGTLCRVWLPCQVFGVLENGTVS